MDTEFCTKLGFITILETRYTLSSYILRY